MSQEGKILRQNFDLKFDMDQLSVDCMTHVYIGFSEVSDSQWIVKFNAKGFELVGFELTDAYLQSD